MKLNEKQREALYCMYCYFENDGVFSYEAAAMDLYDIEIRQNLIEVATLYPSDKFHSVCLDVLSLCKFGFDESIKSNDEHCHHTFMFYSLMYMLIDQFELSEHLNEHRAHWQWNVDKQTWLNSSGEHLN
jgi:hypothetical protein